MLASRPEKDLRARQLGVEADLLRREKEMLERRTSGPPEAGRP